VNVTPGYGYVTVPVGGVGGAITIAESLILRPTDVFAVRGGTDESETLTEKAYVPAVVGLPDNWPEALKARPGGSEPDSVQLKGGDPPEAANV
jgi:hypothetical protein